jgi:DNA-binding response OmpR family regulator
MDKPRILVVEDDLDLAEMLNAYFRVQDYEVLTASWGEEALRISREEPVSIILLDIRLPDIDGYEVCRQLRGQRQTENTPIIFLTEKRDRVDKLQGLELGVVDYITKPFDIQELRLRIRNAINRAERAYLSNPVTDLPESTLTIERLGQLLESNDAWAVLQISVNSLSQFRAMYGFVAADDVLRAVTLMIRNAIREYGNEGDFVGHIGDEDFIIITSPESVGRIRDRIETRIKQSSEYFYPLRDREKVREAVQNHQLRLTNGTIDNTSGTYETIDDLREALFNAAQPNEIK